VQGFGLVYRSPTVYRAAMAVLDRVRAERNRVVVDAVAPGSSVVDLCCGDAAIGAPLARKGCAYLGLDVNRRFVDSARARGLDARVWDARNGEIPQADVVCMLSSLYQFIPDERRLLERMASAARRRVIVSEPVRNWASGDSAMLRALALRLTQVDGRTFERRLTAHRLDELVDGLGRMSSRVALGRELLYVLDVAPQR
jgi:trans-aconitate methyltransferase